jgi:hypothetical protein
MAELTLAQLLPGATQDAEMIMIPKSALPMEAAAENRADVITVALLKRFAEVFTQANRDSDLSRSVVVQEGRPSLQQTFDSVGQSTNWLVYAFDCSVFKQWDPDPLDADIF